MTSAARTKRSRQSAAELETAAIFRTELRRFLRRTNNVAAREQLTPERYDLLLMIKAASATDNPATITSLCVSLSLRQQAATELVKRAGEAGLVVRERSQRDGRVYHLRLTDEGEARFMRAFRSLRSDRAGLAEAFDRLDLHFRASASG